MYNWIKIFHIVGASIIFGSGTGITCLLLFAHIQSNLILLKKTSRLALTTSWIIITPLSLFQLLTGFTIVSIKSYTYHAPWIIGTFSGFLLAGLCWFPCLYFASRCDEALQSIPENIQEEISLPQTYYQAFYKQIIFGSLALGSVLIMLFFMANRAI